MLSLGIEKLTPEFLNQLREEYFVKRYYKIDAGNIVYGEVMIGLVGAL